VEYPSLSAVKLTATGALGHRRGRRATDSGGRGGSGWGRDLGGL